MRVSYTCLSFSSLLNYIANRRKRTCSRAATAAVTCEIPAASSASPKSFLLEKENRSADACTKRRSSRQQTLCATSKDFGRGDQLLLPPLLLLLLLLLLRFTEEYDDERKQCPLRVDGS